jgi:hypothetical protein
MNERACETFLALVSDRLDGAPLAMDPETIEAHLLACPGCRAEAAKLMKDDALLKELRAAESTALEKSQEGHSLVDDQLIRLIVEKLQGLPRYSSNGGRSHDLSDAELDWLSAAGTTMATTDPTQKK